VSDDRIVRVEQACIELAAADGPITFVAVAERAGVARVSLYRNPALRGVVEEHRARAREAHSLIGLAGEVANLRLAVEALSERVRRHEEQLRALGRSNKRVG
jgi:DNA polymerase III delta prime subunit